VSGSRHTRKERNNSGKAGATFAHRTVARFQHKAKRLASFHSPSHVHELYGMHTQIVNTLGGLGLG
jgi:hypothetical protein